MSNIRYLEIDSSYRNREMYPEPGDFVIPISQSSTKNILQSNNSISSSAPQLIWNPDDYVNNGSSGSTYPNPSNNLSHFIVKYPINTMIKTTDYYNGTNIQVATSTGMSTNYPNITSWDFLSSDGTNDYFIINLNEKLTPNSSPAVFDLETTVRSVKFHQLTDMLALAIFIPNGVPGDNYYTDYIIYNQDINAWSPIISYNAKTRIAGLDISYGNLFLWNTSHTLVLRKDYPKETGTLASIINPTNVEFPPTSSNIPGKYDGSFIRFTSPLNKNKIFKISNYVGVYIPPPPPPPPPVDYTATLKYISGSEDGTNVLNTSDLVRTYEILEYTRDNEVPFVYTGSTVSQQEMVCYEIELVDLVLPNLVLVNGGRSAFYPFVYVELQNVSASGAGLTNIIYSNNPNSTRKLFRCPIDDLQSNLISPFIKIDSDGTRQTIKFKPNDNLHFAVYLPNGKLFKTLIQDTFSPDYPNPFVQISALFSIKRL